MIHGSLFQLTEPQCNKKGNETSVGQFVSILFNEQTMSSGKIISDSCYLVLTF